MVDTDIYDCLVVEGRLLDIVAGRHKKPGVEVIDMALTAKLSSLAAAICTQDHMVTDIKVDGASPSSLSSLLIGLFCLLIVLYRFIYLI